MTNLRITPTTKVVAIKDHVSCELGSDTIILQIQGGTYFGLNEVGTAVWKMLQQPQSIADICACITGEFDVEPDQCHQDITALFESLLQAGLVRLA